MAQAQHTSTTRQQLSSKGVYNDPLSRQHLWATGPPSILPVIGGAISGQSESGTHQSRGVSSTAALRLRQ